MVVESYKDFAILKMPDDIGYWLVRADGGKYYEDFFHNNFIAVADNEITLENIEECEKNSIAGMTIEHYKELYANKYPNWKQQQIAHAAKRLQQFRDHMKIGDLVLVPSRRSTHFLIGVITSEVFEVTEETLAHNADVHYSINHYFKRRSVTWIKEVSRNEISEKLHWVLSAHQAVFDLKEHRDYINQLLAPIYIQDGKCHSTLKIDKKSGLNTHEWYDFYSLVKKISKDSDDEVVVKSNVQSPGLIEIVTGQTDILTAVTILVTLTGIFFSKIKIGNIEVLGLVPYFFNEGRLQRKRMKEENKSIEINNGIKQIELERKKLELEKEKLEFQAMKVKEQLRISSFDAGRTVANQTQTDNSENPDADEL